MVIFMAALLDVPREQYEAAELDGAGAVQRFRLRHPARHLGRSSAFAVITGVIATMQYYTSRWSPGRSPAARSAAPGQQFEPGYPDGSTLTLPQLVYNLGLPALRHRRRLRGRARAVRPVAWPSRRC